MTKAILVIIIIGMFMLFIQPYFALLDISNIYSVLNDIRKAMNNRNEMLNKQNCLIEELLEQKNNQKIYKKHIRGRR